MARKQDQRGFDFPLAFCLAKKHKPRQSIPPAGVEYVPAPTAGEPSGDRQRREKALPFLKEEKSEHECARQYEIAIQLVCARHCELPLSKMGSKGLFPVVAVPLAFFGTFFRFERKYYPPRGGSPTVRAGVGASIPNGADGMRLRAHQRAFRSPFGNLRAPKLERNP